MSATEALGTRTDIAPVSGSQEACSPINPDYASSLKKFAAAVAQVPRFT
jgi:hypothetical protein